MHNLSSDYSTGSSCFSKKNTGWQFPAGRKNNDHFLFFLIGNCAVYLVLAFASFPSFFFSLTIKEGYFLYSSDINDYIA